MKENSLWKKGDVVLSKYDLDKYTNNNCMRHLLYRSNFDYELSKMINPEFMDDKKLNLVFVIEDIIYNKEHIWKNFLIIPLDFIRRMDKGWMIQRDHGYVAKVFYDIKLVPVYTECITRMNHQIHHLYQRVIEEMKICLKDYTYIILKGPKQMRRLRKSTFNILNKLLPTDVVHIIVDNVYYKKNKNNKL